MTSHFQGDFLMKPIRKATMIIHALRIDTCILLQLVNLINNVITKSQSESEFKLVVEVPPANNVHHCRRKNGHLKRLAARQHQTAPTRKARAFFQGIGLSRPAATRSSVALNSRSCQAGKLTSSETEIDDQM